MSAVLAKIRANITGQPLISLLIVITVVMSAMLLTLALITLMNISAPYDEAFRELNGAHVWLYFNKDKIRSRDIQRIEQLPGIAASTGLQYSVNTRAQINDTRAWVSLRVLPLEMPDVNKLLIQEGRYLNPRNEELLGSKDLNYLYQLEVGQHVAVTRWDGKEIELPNIGLAYNCMWDTYRNTQPPYVYVSEDTLKKLFPEKTSWDWSLGLRLEDPQSVDAMVALIEDTLRSDALADYTDWQDVRYSAAFASRLNSVFLGSFSFFAILATVVVVASSISSNVLSQFKQIGILKAIGFTKGQILGLYLSQYLLLSLVGCPLGLVIGFWLSPLPLRNVAASLNKPFHPVLSPGLVLLVFAITFTVVILATLRSASRGANANIIRAIAVGAESPRKKLPWIVRLVERLGIPMVFVLGLNDAFAKPFKSLMTGINLTVGVMGIVFGLALNETLVAYKETPSLVGVVYDATVMREFTSDRKTQYILSQAPGVEGFYGEYLVTAETLEGETFQMRAVEGDLDKFPFEISKGRLFRPNTYEAIAGRGLLDWLGLEVGDQITVTFDETSNRTTTWTIVGQYPEPVNAGQRLMVSLPTLTRHLRQAEPNAYYLKLSPDCDTLELKLYLEPRPDSDLNLTLVGDIVPSEVQYLQIAMFVLAAILIGIALINVFNTSLMSMQEKLKMIGVLKTLGMTPAQVVTMVNTTAGFLGFLATCIGIPLGLEFTRLLLNVLTQSYGFDTVSLSFGLVYVVLLLPGMVLVSVLGSLLPARWAAKTSIVQVLRNE